MAVSPLGNVIVVNQMTPAVSSVQNAHQNRIDFQNMAAQFAAIEKEKEVMNVRPTEENKEINPDREHQKQEADEELSKGKKRAKEQNSHTDSLSSEHRLDILV